MSTPQTYFSFADPPVVPSLVLSRIRNRLRDTIAPSEPWVVQACEWYANHIDATGRRPDAETLLYRNEVLPPGGRSTGMVQCGECNRWQPPYYVNAGVCEDCRAGAGVADTDEDSPGWDYAGRREGINALAHGHPSYTVPLPSESIAALALEVLKYLETGRVGKVDFYQRDYRWRGPTFRTARSA